MKCRLIAALLFAGLFLGSFSVTAQAFLICDDESLGACKVGGTISGLPPMTTVCYDNVTECDCKTFVGFPFSALNEWLGPGSTCEQPVVDSNGTGACVLASGTCSEIWYLLDTYQEVSMTLERCEKFGSLAGEEFYYFPNETCMNLTGACRFTEIILYTPSTPVGETECDMLEGSWSGDDCCLEGDIAESVGSGDPMYMNFFTCIGTFNGSWGGTGSTCETCIPDCEGKECGDDGCGGSCGECGSGESCIDYTCVVDIPPAPEFPSLLLALSAVFVTVILASSVALSIKK